MTAPTKLNPLVEHLRWNAVRKFESNFTPERLQLAETIRLQCENAIYAIEQDHRDGDLTDAEAAERMAPYEDHLEHVLSYINDYRAHAAKVLENVRARKGGGQ